MGMIKYRHELKHKDWNEVSQEELRHMFYENGFFIRQVNKNTGEIIETKYVFYKRSTSKSRTGRALFIREDLKETMELWANMNLDIPQDKEVDLAGLLAYQSLVGSGIKYTKKIPVDNILMITDVDSKFKQVAKVIRTGNNGFLDGFEEEVEVVNSLFDGQSLVIPKYFPDGKSMILLRNHFFKSAGMKCDIQQFLKDNKP